MLPEIAYFLLILSLCISSLYIFFTFYIKFNFDIVYSNFTKYILLLQSLFILFSILILIFSFLNDDFSVKYIAYNSNSNLNIIYKISALWAAHEGSFLLWLFILSFIVVFISFSNNNLEKKLFLTILFVINFIIFFFILYLVLVSNPFERINIGQPIDGSDLNPLLQDIGLIIHPPILYTGYSCFVVVFSFFMSSLLVGNINLKSISWVYNWVIFSWIFLTLGIGIGSWWAYCELGWGGWWFWDPVENTSLMPWLTITSLIHCLIVIKNRGNLYNLSAFLSIIIFLLILIGTFLVRSGILNSVHAFANDSGRGNYILFFFFFIFLFSFLIYFIRSKKIKRKFIYKFISKDVFLLFNCFLLLILTFIILLGTFYPVFLDFFYGKKISIGAPYFNIIFISIIIFCIFFITPADLINFYKNYFKKLFFILIFIFFSSIFFSYLIISFKYIFNFYVFFSLAVSIWIIKGSIFSFFKFKFNLKSFLHFIPSKIAHIGVVCVVIGVSFSSIYKIEKDVIIKSGDIININNNKLILIDINDIEGSNFVGFKANFLIIDNNGIKYNLFPEKRFFFISGISTSETSIKSEMFSDFYIAMGEFIENNLWSCRIYYKPYINLIWYGIFIMFISGLLILIKSFFLF